MGMNFFPSRHRCCKGCSQRQIKVNDQEVTEYYHRGVVCNLIGFDMTLPLDMELIRPGEGEVVAAKRLLERVFANYSRFFDAVAADALYMESPFFNFCLDQGKDIIAVLKGNHRSLLEDAEGLFSDMEPKTWQMDRRTIKYWQAEGFNSAEAIKAPLRILHTEESHLKRQRIAGKWVETKETQSWWWATTISSKVLSTRQLWQAGHKRWDIENKNFNTLVNNWPLNHCFKHDPTAILNFVLTLFIAFVLIQSFYHRNLKAALRIQFTTLISIADELHCSLTKGGLRAPWHEQRVRPPP
jgi:hypothetical protein